MIMGADNEPMFCLVDVCQTLGLNPSKIAQRLTDDVLSKYPIADALGRQRENNFVNEDGLYDVILDSRKKKAKMFRKWVTSEVLPTIRKTGGYMVTNQEDTPEMIMARAVMVAQDTIKRHEQRMRELEDVNKRQSAEITVMKPKADFYDTIMGIGRNNLFKFLREHKVVDERNVPYQLYVDKRWFKSIPVYFDDPRTGLPSMYLKTVVFPAGIDGIRQLLKSKGYKKNRAQEYD